MKLSDNFGQSIEFELSTNTRQIGVNCSGGADSAILLYMICDYIQQNDIDATVSVMTCANDNKNRWNARKAASVINYTINKLKFNSIDMHYIYYRDRQDIKYFHEVEAKLFADGRIDLLVAGITANPKVTAIVEDSNGNMIDLSHNALVERNSNQAPQWTTSTNGNKFYTPFINVDKRFVASMYSEYNVMDMLDLTRSCEATPQPPGLVHTVEYDPNFENQPCGKCWWCLERKWAFGHL